MPRLGEPVEPAQAERVEPWWRGVDTSGGPVTEAPAGTLPKAMSWPLD
jgi:hypothetical protein